jgi:oligopeptide/dipeptide ABC transporter ATP-binding protein
LHKKLLQAMTPISENSEELLGLRNLSVEFSLANRTTLTAVAGVDVVVRANESHGLIGESGSGKSVTALAALGLHGSNAKIKGDLTWRGRSLLNLSEGKWRNIRGGGMTMLFQDAPASLNPALRIGTQLEAVIRLHQKLDSAAATIESFKLLNAVRMSDPERVMRAFPHECSGGMAQRVALALALACKPQLLIADEPTSALDVTVAAQIVELLKQIRKEFGLALLVISHDLSAVARLCDRISVMYLGKIVESGPTDAIIRNPQHPYTAALLSAAIWQANLNQQQGDILAGETPSLLSPPNGCRFHPRCPKVFGLCNQREPTLHERETPNHVSACWFYDELRSPIPDAGLI